MSSETTDRALEETTRELLDVLREIERAVEPPDPRRFLRPPTPDGLREFTSEVGIPAAILILRTNIAALELLQRSLRIMGDDGNRRQGESPETGVRRRAADLTSTSLSRLDDALGDLQAAVDGRAIDRSPDELIEEARQRTTELEAQLSASDEASIDDELGRRGGAEIDVEAELDSLRESVDTADGADDGDTDSSDS